MVLVYEDANTHGRAELRVVTQGGSAGIVPRM